MANEKNKTRVFLYGGILIAVVLGVYAQDIAYFLHNNLAIPLMAGLSAATILSILLFLGPPILVSGFNKKHKIGKKEFDIYFGINLLTGVVISAFSLIVLIAWCG